MSNFSRYSRYYDLLYSDKDYSAEAEFVDRLIRKNLPGAKSICEFGCGTGRYSEILGRFGYELHGVDMSRTMLEEAKTRRERSGRDLAERISFSLGDIRNIRLGKRFDVVAALFHVMSYLTLNEDLEAAIETAHAHLNPGGIFVFDFWYGPAVLTERPSIRVKRYEDDITKIVRISEPCMHPDLNVVVVDFNILVTDKQTGLTEEIIEKHSMRYLFLPELSHMLKYCGLKMLESVEWMGNSEPSTSNWGACIVARS